MLKMELHKEIAAWLDKFKLIQANSKALTPNAEIEDLVAIIRDGVVLCQVKQMVDAYYVSYYILLSNDLLLKALAFNSQTSIFSWFIPWILVA